MVLAGIIEERELDVHTGLVLHGREVLDRCTEGDWVVLVVQRELVS
jgi:ribosomal protein L11 methylase PrmA